MVFREEDEQFIPGELRRVNCYRLYTKEGYEKLLRWLHAKPEIEPPPVGPTPQLSQLVREYFQPNSLELKPDALPVKYDETMLDDLARVLAEIRQVNEHLRGSVCDNLRLSTY